MTLDATLRAAILQWAERGRLRVLNRIRDFYLSGRALNRRTGTAVRSVASTVNPDGKGFRVGTVLNYLIAWENGIRAHQIVATNVQALKFKVGGVTMFRKRVFMPAQAARPSFKPAMDDEEPFLRTSAEQALQRVIVDHFPNRTIHIGRQ